MGGWVLMRMIWLHILSFFWGRCKDNAMYRDDDKLCLCLCASVTILAMYYVVFWPATSDTSSDWQSAACAPVRYPVISACQQATTSLMEHRAVWICNESSCITIAASFRLVVAAQPTLWPATYTAAQPTPWGRISVLTVCYIWQMAFSLVSNS
jgi:hypothetical protein